MAKEDKTLYQEVIEQFDEDGNLKTRRKITYDSDGYKSSIPDMYMDNDGTNVKKDKPKKSKKGKKSNSKKLDLDFSIITKGVPSIVGGAITIIVMIIVLTFVGVLVTYMINNAPIVQDNLQIEQMFMR